MFKSHPFRVSSLLSLLFLAVSSNVFIPVSCSLRAQELPTEESKEDSEQKPADEPMAPASENPAGSQPPSALVPPSDAGKTADAGQTVIAAPTTGEGMISYVDKKMSQLVLGVRITSANPCQGVFATIPIPMEYPEQKVKVVETNIPANVKYSLRPLTETVQQLVIEAPTYGGGQPLEATLTLEVEKYKILGPADPSTLVIPKKLPKGMTAYMGPSPYIDTKSSRIKKIAKDIADSNPPNAWAQVEKIYDWVRENIKYREGDIKTVQEALMDKEGDCEELSGTFVAICRVSRIPARCVWVYGHTYPEFYLEDEQGNGYWFPCQAAGTRAFGYMDEPRPILQKGDRFKVPEKPELQRYVSEYLKIKKVIGGGKPDVVFIQHINEKQ